MSEDVSEPGAIIRVALLTPSGAIRAGLRSLLGIDERLAVILEASTLADLPKAAASGADVIILTSGAFREVDIGKELHSIRQVGVLVLVEDGPREMPSFTTPTGQPLGFLPLDAEAETLTAAVRALYEGLSVAPPAWTARPRNGRGGAGSAETGEGSEALTPREIEVLQQLALGLTNKQIALALGMSEHTAKYHISAIYAKLGVMNRAEAVRVGIRRGWIAI